MPESVTTIGEGAFANCTALTTINIPSKLKKI
ncbi:leucine-rich repeat protein [Intestinibacter sp.]